MKLLNFFLVFFLSLTMFSSVAKAQTGCPGCLTMIPANLPQDTIYFDTIPNGIQGEYYEEDLSFRLPLTTDPFCMVLPDIPCGITIDEIRILSVSGLPPGLSWETDQSDGIYVLPGEKDGCVRLCGTPILDGEYVATISAEGVVFGFGAPVDFELDMVIEPAQNNNAGFSVAPNAGCAPFTASFQNNVPSNGNPGITYSWDFGNNVESLLENPADQVYDQPGEYIINYEATIDTTGFLLTQIVVNSTGCSDLLSAPDYYIRVFDPMNNEIFNSGSGITDTDAPVTFSFSPPIQLGTGSYVVQVWDEDLPPINPDDDCGSVNFNQGSNGVLTNGGDLEVDLTIINPVTVISTSDTIQVFGTPEPMVSAMGSPVDCPVTLMSSETEGNQWYSIMGMDTTLIEEATDQTFIAVEDGDYYVELSTDQGCVGASEPFTVQCLTSVEDPASGISDFIISPNPTSGLVNLQFDLKQSSNVQLRLMDTNGRAVFSSRENMASGLLNLEFDWRGLPAGVYILQVVGDDLQLSRKVVISGVGK